MHPQTLQKAGSHLVRSTVLVSTLMAAFSLPSFAAPLPPQSGYLTPTRDDVPYGEVPRTLLMIPSQNPAIPSSTQMAPMTIGKTAANGLPRSLEIAAGGGGMPQRSLPQFIFVPENAQNVGGELNAPVRSQPFQVREVRTNPGFLDQSDRNVIQVSF